MKKSIITLAYLLITTLIFAQAPQKMSYQAVVRNATGNLVTNTSVGMQISILQGATTGTAVYVERQFPTTNANGLVSLEIGTGTVISGDFTTIDWANGTYFIKTETDLNGGSNYTITGVSQLLSVPYALHANTADSIAGTVNYTETDPIYTNSQASNITSTDITNLSNLSGTNTGDQTLAIAGQNLSISGSNGNMVTIPSGAQFMTRATIDTLNPTNGQIVYDTTDQVTLMWDGTHWIQLSNNCFPQPTTASAGSNQYITDTSTSVTLAANTPTEGTGTWSIISGTGGSFANANSPTTTFTGTACTTYTLQWAITTTCATSTANVNITFHDTPTMANAGPNQTINSAVTTVALAANTPTEGTGTWSIINGTGGSFANANDPTTNFTGTACTAYTLQWTIATACATSTANVNITFNAIPTTANAGANIYSLTQTTVTLNANNPSVGTGAWTIVSGGSGSFSNPNAYNSNFTASSGVYTLRWTITACSQTYSEVTVYIGNVVGQYAYGGVIFYVDGTGLHGLVCAVSDQSTGAPWGCAGTAIAGADSSAIGTGAQNTIDIEAGCTTPGTAADICANLTLNGFSDWFLPSTGELTAMYNNNASINTTATANGGSVFNNINYWSSTEIDMTLAYYFDFFSGGGGNINNKASTLSVRAVRAF